MLHPGKGSEREWMLIQHLRLSGYVFTSGLLELYSHLTDENTKSHSWQVSEPGFSTPQPATDLWALPPQSQHLLPRKGLIAAIYPPGQMHP